MSEIATYLGVHRTTVSEWWGQYQQQGEAALHQQKRGSRVGTGRSLSETQAATVQGLLQAHFPDELNIDSALWTRTAVQELIACECGVEMPIRTVGEYLKRWGYTPQKPLKRAYEQNPKLVRAWLETEYPAIEQRAEIEGAEIAWGDESGLRSDAQVGRGYAPIGQTPEIHYSRQRVSVNYIASISNSREGALHALHPEADSTSDDCLHEPTDCQTNSQIDVDCRPSSCASLQRCAGVAPETSRQN